MKKFAMIAATVALAGASANASAFFSTANIAGDFMWSGYADGSPNTFSLGMSGLSGDLSVQTFPNGFYEVSGTPGTNSFNFNQFVQPLGFTLALPSNFGSIFSGTFGSTLQASFNGGPFVPVPHGTTSTIDFNDPMGTIGLNLTIDYNGTLSPAVMGFLNDPTLFNGALVNPAASGTLSALINIDLGANTLTADFTETNLGWQGFGALLTGVDMIANGLAPTPANLGAYAMTGNANQMGGTFSIQGASVKVPEPASLALLGLGLAGLGAMRRRKTA